MSARPKVADDAWERFRRLPSEIAHPSHLAELFDGAIDEDMAGRLAKQERLAPRLSAYLERRLALPDVEQPADPRDRTIALATAKRLTALARQAGAVSWASAVAREIHAERVAALREAIGEDAYTAALAHRSEAIETDAPEDLAAAIAADGEGCLAAWLLSQSEGVAARVLLRWPAGHEVPAPREDLHEAGPRIMRALAS